MFVFRELEKTTIENCKKKLVLLLSIFVSKYAKDFILITKDNYIFNIVETVTIEFIDAILEN